MVYFYLESHKKPALGYSLHGAVKKYCIGKPVEGAGQKNTLVEKKTYNEAGRQKKHKGFPMLQFYLVFVNNSYF